MFIHAKMKFIWDESSLLPDLPYSSVGGLASWHACALINTEVQDNLSIDRKLRHRNNFVI